MKRRRRTTVPADAAAKPLTAQIIFDYFLGLVVSGGGLSEDYPEFFLQRAAGLAGCEVENLDSVDFSQRTEDLKVLDVYVSGMASFAAYYWPQQCEG